MNPLKNLIFLFRKYTTATLLNVIGLSVAFASFMIIMTQVKYDLTYDRQYKNKDRIVRLEYLWEPNKYVPRFSRGIANKILAVSPEIEQKGLITSLESNFVYDLQTGIQSRTSLYPIYKADTGILDILDFEYIWGNAEQFTKPNTVLISQEISKSLYGDGDPVGRMLVIGEDYEHPLKIIGVYKNFPKNSYLHSGNIVRFIGDEDLDNIGNWGYCYYLRLNRPESIMKVQQDIQTILQEIDPIHLIDQGLYKTVRLNPITQFHYTNDTFFDDIEPINLTTVYSLLITAVLIVLIAAINYINFSVALVPIRIRYINTQKVLGSTNKSIRYGIIGESINMTLLSFLVSLIIVELFASSPFVTIISEAPFIGPDYIILSGTALFALLTGIISGIYPAIYCTSFRPALILKGTFGLSPKGKRLRTLLIIIQYIVSIVMIIVSSTIYLQNSYIQRYDIGLERENILECNISKKIAEHEAAFADRLKSNSNIADVTFSSIPLTSQNISLRGANYKGESISFYALPVASNFLSFMGIDIIEGRDFVKNDELKLNRPIIFNKTAQRQNSITVGAQIENMDVVGIARDINFQPLHCEIAPFAFVCRGTSEGPYLTNCYIKTNTTNIPAVIDFVRKTIHEFDPHMDTDIKFLNAAFRQFYIHEHKLSTLTTLFSLLSMLIALIGVLGLVYLETQYRSKEIALRKIHGATIGKILRMFNKTYVRIVLISFAFAAPIGYFIVKRWLENFAYRIPFPIWVFIAALLIVLAVTIATVSIRSYRAATAPPVKWVKKE